MRRAPQRSAGRPRWPIVLAALLGSWLLVAAASETAIAFGLQALPDGARGGRAGAGPGGWAAWTAASTTWLGWMGWMGWPVVVVGLQAAGALLLLRRRRSALPVLLAWAGLVVLRTALLSRIVLRVLRDAAVTGAADPAHPSDDALRAGEAWVRAVMSIGQGLVGAAALLHILVPVLIVAWMLRAESLRQMRAWRW